MTIDRMESRVDVAPSSGGGGGSAGGAGSAAPTPSQGNAQTMEAMRPVVMQIVQEELMNKLRIAGLR